MQKMFDDDDTPEEIRGKSIDEVKQKIFDMLEELDTEELKEIYDEFVRVSKEEGDNIDDLLGELEK